MVFYILYMSTYDVLGFGIILNSIFEGNIQTMHQATLNLNLLET